MKLKNKRTGEIIDIYKGEITLHYNQGRKTIHFKHLEDLEEWEEVPEEPKEYWYIGDNGEVYGFSDYYVGTELEDARRKIGNLFDIRAEAEKAVEKLKVAKRLKDAGLEIIRYETDGGVDKNDMFIGEIRLVLSTSKRIDYKLLDLLFGGEE